VNSKQKKAFLIKSLLQIFLFSGPLILLSAYLVYIGRPYLRSEYGVEISDLSYSLVLITIMIIVMHLTSFNIFSVCFGGSKNNGNEKQ